MDTFIAALLKILLALPFLNLKIMLSVQVIAKMRKGFYDIFVKRDESNQFLSKKMTNND